MALQWETDRGLQLRMALALVLVVVLPVAFVYAFVFLMNTVGVALLTFATERPWRGRFYVEPWLVVGAVAVGFLVQYRFGERSALRAVGARRVDAEADGTVRSFSLGGHERWANDPCGTLTSRVAAAGGRAFVLAGGELVGVGAGGTAWRVPLDEPEPFTPAFGPFAVGEGIVLGSPGEVRGYWRSQLHR